MREIKFRCWDKDTHRMYYQSNEHPCFTYGDLCHCSLEDVLHYHKDDFELMQYTGLKDKNGREIYEGDIIGIHNDFYPLEVMFGEYSYPNIEERHYGFYVKSIRDEITCPIRGKNENEIIIITNIYENDRF